MIIRLTVGNRIVIVLTVVFVRQTARVHVRETATELVTETANDQTIANRVMALAAKATEMLDV
jgi:hypothetical protein